MSAIFIIVCRKQFIFELEPGFDGSKPYMKCGRNLIKNDLVRVITTSDGCKLIGGGHFVGHIDYLSLGKKTIFNLNQRLMEAIHI